VPEALPRVFQPRTIRVQLTVAITAVVALVVALAGMAIVLLADHRDRDDVDKTLATRVAQVRTAAAKTGKLPTDGTYAVRLLDGTDVRAEVGSSTKFSIPVKNGYSTVTAADGSHWRSWAETLKTGAQLQVLVDLQDVEEQHSGNVRMIDLIVVLAALVAAAGTWIVGGLVLRPLIRSAEDATPDEDDDADRTLVRPTVEPPPAVVPVFKPPPVVDRGALEREAEELAQQIAAEFAKAADQLRAPLAELGEGLDQLLDNPDMPATQRHLYLASIQTEYRRIVSVVEDLEARRP
jgi:signal transduction histidine kinase